MKMIPTRPSMTDHPAIAILGTVNVASGALASLKKRPLRRLDTCRDNGAVPGGREAKSAGAHLAQGRCVRNPGVRMKPPLKKTATGGGTFQPISCLWRALVLIRLLWQGPPGRSIDLEPLDQCFPLGKVCGS